MQLSSKSCSAPLLVDTNDQKIPKTYNESQPSMKDGRRL